MRLPVNEAPGADTRAGAATLEAICDAGPNAERPTAREKPPAAFAEHPLAALVPRMQPGDYIELTKDIELHGLGEPVWTYEGKILDGRHRARACAELGVECPTRDTPATIQQDSS